MRHGRYVGGMALAFASLAALGLAVPAQASTVTRKAPYQFSCTATSWTSDYYPPSCSYPYVEAARRGQLVGAEHTSGCLYLIGVTTCDEETSGLAGLYVTAHRTSALRYGAHFHAPAKVAVPGAPAVVACIALVNISPSWNEIVYGYPYRFDPVQGERPHCGKVPVNGKPIVLSGALSALPQGNYAVLAYLGMGDGAASVGNISYTLS